MILLALICAVAAGYQITALLACLAHLRKEDPQPASTPPVSILKPVYGADAGFCSCAAGALKRSSSLGRSCATAEVAPQSSDQSSAREVLIGS